MNKILKHIFSSKRTTDLDKFEMYKEYYNPGEAYIAKGVLETNGIKCFIDGDTLSSVYPSQLSFSGLRLFVRRADFLMADELLGNAD